MNLLQKATNDTNPHKFFLAAEGYQIFAREAEEFAEISVVATAEAWESQDYFYKTACASASSPSKSSKSSH